MTPLIQICAVIVTLALVAIAVATVRAMLRLERAADEFSQTNNAIQKFLAESKTVTHQIQEVVGRAGSVVDQVRGVADRFQEVGERTARLSSAMVDEVEAPIRTAVAAMRGVRAGTGFLLDRLTNRLAHRRSAINGGNSHA
jgi:uncharacterized protein YoxC